VHGGYGFMEEYDVQLYFRRAKTLRLLAGDPRDDLGHVADRCFGPVGAPLSDDESVVLGPLPATRRPDRDRREASSSGSRPRSSPSGPTPAPSSPSTSPTR